MKRIVLTTVLEQYAKDYLSDLKALNDNPEDRLNRLKADLQRVHRGIEANYVAEIIQYYDSIVKANPEELVSIIVPLFAKYASMDLSQDINMDLTNANGKHKTVTSKFHKLVADAMGYDDVQEKVFPKYIKKMGIKSCVYCNSQYAVAAKKGKTNIGTAYRSTYTIDHYLPKSRYPYLATSYFNLYPCCSTCNQTKSYRSPVFELYVKPNDPLIRRNPFVFHLDSYSFVKYSMSGDAEDLKISLLPRAGVDAEELENYENYFHISKLYENYNDTVEEVIWKYRMYNKAGRDALRNSFAPLLPHPTNFNRFILNNYDREEDMLKRPLAKLVQDVAKELGVI